MQTLDWIAVLVAGFAGSTVLWWVFHCICTRLEQAGYLYYQEKSAGSAGGSVLGEIDKLVRPSIEHTIELRETPHVEQHGIDGD